MQYTRYAKLLLFLVTVVIITSCHSRKLAVKNIPKPNGIDGILLPKRGPYVMVKPEREIAEKYSALIGVKRSDIQNGRLYNFIEEWYGTPYRFGGMGKDGVDCSGLVFLLQLQVYDQPVPRTCALQVNVVKRKYEEELKEGDLVF
ncbi:C40 family peptidase, partial [Mucilaginibacter sp.]|uniref:C40 family peptidase n=1 Tax=Mucilaginibacter sp. TaxID=1882438 RepID=UPI0035BBC8CC